VVESLNRQQKRAILNNRRVLQMARTKTGEFDNYKYQQQYIKENLKFVNVPFNSKLPEEMMLYDYLNEHTKETSEKKAAYIKRLIREDMEKNKP
jgi:uncharacterized protein YfaT (DUF1175 family)